MLNGAAAKLVTDFKILIDDAEGLVKTTTSRVGGRIGELGQRLKNRLEEGKTTLTTSNKGWIETAQDTKKQAESYLREHAWTALLVATGLGALFGFLFHRNRRPAGSSRTEEE